MVAIGLVLPRAFCGYICPMGTLIDMTDWAVCKRIQRFHVHRPGWWRNLRYFVLLGVLAARLIAARIAGAIDALIEPATALGEGRPVTAQAMPITEVSSVAAALVRASDLLRARTSELDAATLPGFVDPTPLALLREDLAGKALVYSTTNGTVALSKARDAASVYAGALLNGEAVVEHVERTLGARTVLVVCAGSGGRVNLEDLYGAGYVVSLLARRAGAYELSDAALAARALHGGSDAYECLAAGRIGRLMLERGLEPEVRFAAQKSKLAVVPRLVEGRVLASER